jgi:hypothetical protein
VPGIEAKAVLSKADSPFSILSLWGQHSERAQPKLGTYRENIPKGKNILRIIILQKVYGEDFMHK